MKKETRKIRTFVDGYSTDDLRVGVSPKSGATDYVDSDYQVDVMEEADYEAMRQDILNSNDEIIVGAEGVMETEKEAKDRFKEELKMKGIDVTDDRLKDVDVPLLKKMTPITRELLDEEKQQIADKVGV